MENADGIYDSDVDQCFYVLASEGFDTQRVRVGREEAVGDEIFENRVVVVPDIGGGIR